MVSSKRRRLALLALALAVFGGEDLGVFGMRVSYPHLMRFHTWFMRLTEFWRRMNAHFGETYAESWARDYVIAPLGGRTVAQALADGESVKTVWRAVCQVEEVSSRLR
jgi:hypothetical protein